MGLKSIHLWKCCFNMVLKAVRAPGEHVRAFSHPPHLPPPPDGRQKKKKNIYIFCFACQPVRVTFISDPIILPHPQHKALSSACPPPPILHGAATIWKHILVNNISQYPNNR